MQFGVLCNYVVYIFNKVVGQINYWKFKMKFDFFCGFFFYVIMYKIMYFDINIEIYVVKRKIFK